VGNGGVLVDAEPKNSQIAAVSIDSSCRSGCWSGLCWGAEDFEYLLERGGGLVILADSELENRRIATVPIGSSC
jgi:hypothetical protein